MIAKTEGASRGNTFKNAKPVRTWHCGTLVYTSTGLLALFFYLLWGNFCFTLMQVVVPSILPLKLKALGASNILIGLLLTSIFPVLGMFISPYLSFKSDYLRTSWGRRIPFFIFSLPLVCLSILLLAFSGDITHLLHHSGFLAKLSMSSALLLVLAACVVVFQFVDVLIYSVYQYIFNDTVPVMLIGRFVGLMQVIGGIAGFLYNYCIFKYAESHMKEIFVGTAILYLIGIGMVCLFVKEGEYPPVTDEERNRTHGWAGFRMFFRESFSHKFYWTKYAYSTTSALAWGVTAPFSIFFYKEMGLSLDQVGRAVAIVSVAGIAAAYFLSVFIDRWHPLRILTYSSVFAVVFTVSNWVWLFVSLPSGEFFWLHMLGAGLLGAFHGTLGNLAAMPFDIRLQPKSRFGQFCSAQAILRNGCTVVAGLGIGVFFDVLKRIFHGSDYAYRFNFLWSAFWYLLSAVIIYSLYRQWHSLGGDRNFRPPAPWSETGFEEMEQTPFIGVQVRWLNHALGLIRLLMLFSILYLIPLTCWLWHIGWKFDFKLHLLLIIPLSIVSYATWAKVESSIKADIKRSADGVPLRNGVPHHGVLFLKACALFMLLVIGIGKTVAALQDGQQGGIMAFSIANQITNALVITAVLVLCHLERGYDPMLDYDGRKTPLA